MKEGKTVLLVGLFPDTYRLCAGRCRWVKDPAPEEEYPPLVKEQWRQVQAFYLGLLETLPDVRPVTVGFWSIQGLFLAARYRLDTQKVYAVVGRKAIPLERGFGPVEE
ncbi:MAG: hypothetical protein QJR00_07095, partial [Bacillota bacterium]|nr:hypothetical protein [Bacillota bacterium]